MYFIKNYLSIYKILLKLSFAWTWETAWVAEAYEEKVDPLIDKFKSNLNPEQLSKFEQAYSVLDDSKKEDLKSYLPNIWNNLDSFLDSLEEISKKEMSDKKDNSSIFDYLKEKKPELIEKIEKLEDEYNEVLYPYVKYNESYTNLLSELLEKKWDPNDAEYQSVSDNLNQKITSIELVKKRIWEIEIEIRNMETESEKKARYEWLEKWYESVKDNENLKDIIQDKEFNDLSAGDIYAMLNENPDEVRELLLSTIQWDKIDLDNWWDSLKWEELRVNFWRNKWLDQIIGAWDILDVENVKSVKINGVEWHRRAEPRIGYYSESGNYLAIHNWYKIEITDTKNIKKEGEMELFSKNGLSVEQARENRLLEVRWEEIASVIWNLINEEIAKNPEAKKVENPYKSETDKRLINAIISKEENKYLNATVDENSWDIIVWEDFNISHLWEALNNYWSTKKDIYEFLSNNEDISDLREYTFDTSSFKIKWNDEFIKNAFEDIIWKNIVSENNIDLEVSGGQVSIIINSENSDLNIWKVFSSWYEYEWKWTSHEKYISYVNQASIETWVPSWAIIQLIYHENRWWNPHIKAPWSSAYGLGQMIDSTWNIFWAWLDRHDPKDQLLATSKYMSHLKETKNCSWEEVLAYYNTWPGIKSLWQETINKYFYLNPAIANKVPYSEWKNSTSYFIWAVSYYNDISYNEAKSRIG